MTNILVTIETDAETALKWVGTEAEDALKALGSGLGVIVKTVEPTIYKQLQAEVTSFVSQAESAGSIEDIEQDFLEHLESTGSELWKDASSLQGPILQLLISVAKGALLAAL